MAAPANPTSLLEHPDPWTLEEVLALPEDYGQRVELVDGTLIVSPAPSRKHQRVLHRIQVALDGATPADLEMLPGINIVLNGERLLIPDVVVMANPGDDGVYSTSEDLLVAVEILSPSTRAYDRAFKRQLYAEAQVPFYWVVDPDTEPVSTIAYEFDGEGYREYARSEAGQLVIDRPFPVKLDLTKPGC